MPSTKQEDVVAPLDRSVNFKIILVGLLTVLVTGAIAWFGYGLAQRMIGIEGQWRQHNQDNTQAYEAIVRVRANFGYGGFIHKFKNYILRKDPALLDAIQNSLEQTRQAIQNYPISGLGPKEIEALGQLTAVVNEYVGKLVVAKALVAKGAPTTTIDQQVRVNDKPAIQALEHLTAFVQQSTNAYVRAANQDLSGTLAYLGKGALLLPLVLLAGGMLMVVLQMAIRSNTKFQAANQQLNDVFNAAPDAMLIVSRQGLVARANRQAEQLLGYPAHALVGMTIESLMPERYREHHKALREQAMQHPDDRPTDQSREFVALRRQGGSIPVEIGLSFTQVAGETQAIAILHDVSERRAVEATLRNQQDVLNKAQKVAQFGSWEWEIKDDSLSWSDETCRIFGVEPGSFVPSYEDFLNRLHRDDRDLVIDAVNSTVVFDRPYSIEHRIIRADGEERIVQQRGEVFRNQDGEAVHMVGSIHDITERKRTDIALQLADNVFEHTSEAILITDAENRVLRVNDAFTRISGYTREEAIGEVPQHLMKSERHSTQFYERMWNSLNETGYWQGEIWDRRKNSEIYPSRHNISTVRDDSGRIIQHISIFADITQEKHAEQRIQRLAQYDQLTGLPNRLLFNDRLYQAFVRAKRAGNKVGLMFIDLDRFKVVNDTLGHPAGDALLQEVASRLQACVRGQDTVARLGGDEFTVILEDLQQADGAAVVAQKILSSFQQTINLQGTEVTSGCSIGISIYPDDGDKAETVIKNADMAMYQAKKRGRNCYQFYSDEFAQHALDRFILENKLRFAILNEELELYYQPQINMETGKLIGVEALVRWNDPAKGVVPPDEFIPLAEETGLIDPIGQWVLRKACQQAKAWQDKGYARFRMTVNVSGYQFSHGCITDSVSGVLIETGLEAQYLELEITESYIMANPEQGAATLDALRDMGITLAIDDFGTGYSSLSYLKSLPIDRLKIDRSFVMDIPHDKDDEAIVSTVISMARNLGLDVIAEGVESTCHISFLAGQGCTDMQGYYFSRPLPKQEFEEKFLVSPYLAVKIA